MSKMIFPEEGFSINDLLTEDGVTLEMSNEFCGIDEDAQEYSKDVYMSNDEMIKFLNMDDEDDEDDESINVDVRMPWDLSFDKLRSKMIDLLGNGLVMKLLRREGAGKEMSEDAQVSVRYIGYFEHQDEPFDASYNRGRTPDVLQLGDQGSIIPGLEVALRSMKKHEISVFLIQPEYAYGEAGCLPRIPANQEVLFVIHLIDYAANEFADSFHNLSPEERKLYRNVEKNVLILIAKACDNFKKGKIKQAIGHYTKAARMLEAAHLANDMEEDDQKKLLTRVYVNLTICFNKENKPRSACAAFNQIPNRNAKAHFNHGRALIRLGEFERAREELLNSRKLEPRNKDTAVELKLVKELNSKYNSLRKRLEAHCFLFTGAEAVSPEFINATHEICTTLQNDNNVLRLNFPSGLTIDEDKYIRDVAVNFGLSIINHVRYGKETVFLAKPDY